MKQIIFTTMMGLWATGAFAHSPLEATIPANEPTVAEAPSEIAMDFKGDIRLTRVSMTHADHPSVGLDLDGIDGFISDYAIPLQSMGSGVYSTTLVDGCCSIACSATQLAGYGHG
ncbi:hypothetical protein SAMN04488527_1723 [Aliiroseovarius crassostreae]|uniref:copper resistance protein CopC n=1 Tax=Aliiroseovarius crassostreae TaxID=154981 RepID=UPI0008E6E230|nr:copper resistance protein CopC [Aliiroseovarius crassostreae]SFU98652.1 hypothetical protein SAMN04488527_1723 [Aliiroseovarius crassostreae]